MALPLFAATLFVSAFILFLIQPMIGKLILPKLGGTPQVWNTCMVFFQTALLAGYAYTHSSSTRLPLRRQLAVHAGLLFLPFLVLLPLGPFNFDQAIDRGIWSPPLGGNPILSTLGILTLLVGLPFFVVATSAPLLQKWFVHTGHPAAKDPYFLYGASNLGSLLALLAYPALIEPYFGLKEAQPYFWIASYVGLGMLVLWCASLAWKSPPLMELPPTALEVPAPAPVQEAIKAAPSSSVSRKKFGKGKLAATPSIAVSRAEESLEIRPDVISNWRRLRWVLLAAAPSSLMLGVTTHICTDLSPIPLLWVVPLALYLLTFILVFMRWPLVWVGTPHKVVLFLQPLLVLGLCLFLVGQSFASSPLLHILLALGAFFATALVCHGELARDRPSPRYLTEFYLWMSVGGMLGGMFNGLVAPLIFWGVVEFPLAIVLGCLLRPQQKADGWTDETLLNWFPELAPWARNRGDALAQSYHRPPPHSNYLLNYGLDVLLPLLLGLLTFVLVYFISRTSVFNFLKKMGMSEDKAGDWFHASHLLVVVVAPMALCFFFAARPLRLALGLGIILLIQFGSAHEETVVYANRSYFGVLRVREGPDRNGGGICTTLTHGTTHHGLNFQFPRKYHRLATTYYHQFGPAGMVMEKYNWFFAPTNKDVKGQDYNGPLIDALITYPADARMPACLVGLGASFAPLPLEQLVGAWSEPPYCTIGLGTGTMASYGRPFQHVHYYEIDNQIRKLNLPEDEDKADKLWGEALKAQLEAEAVVKKAGDNSERTIEVLETAKRARLAAEAYHPFNYLSDAKKRGSEVQVRMGDARLRMAFPYKPYDEKEEREGLFKGDGPPGGGPDNFYHMMVVDAFSSDAIPVHLITKEAIEMYFKKLTPEGILCVHTSNRHVDLVPVVDAVAKSIKTYDENGLAVLKAHDNSIYGLPGHFTSEWVMVARSMDVLKKLKTPPQYEEKAKKSYIDRGFSPEGLERRVDLWKYWSNPRELPRELYRPLRYPWTDDYSNVLSVFRW